jgi:hypothetical protein
MTMTGNASVSMVLCAYCKDNRAAADMVGTGRINNLRTPAIPDIVVHVKVIGRLRRSDEIGEL